MTLGRYRSLAIQIVGKLWLTVLTFQQLFSLLQSSLQYCKLSNETRSVTVHRSPSGTDRGPAYLRVKRVLLCLSYRQWRLYLWHTAHSGIEPSHLTRRRWHSRHARDSSGCPFWGVAGVGASDCGRSISGVCKPDMAHRRTIQSQFERG